MPFSLARGRSCGIVAIAVRVNLGGRCCSCRLVRRASGIQSSTRGYCWIGLELVTEESAGAEEAEVLRW